MESDPAKFQPEYRLAANRQRQPHVRDVEHAHRDQARQCGCSVDLQYGADTSFAARDRGYHLLRLESAEPRDGGCQRI